MPQSVLDKLDGVDFSDAPRYVVEDVLKYYYANLADETPWVVIPVVNFDAYYGNTNFGRKWLSKLPKDLIQRETFNRGVSRIKVVI